LSEKNLFLYIHQTVKCSIYWYFW